MAQLQSGTIKDDKAAGRVYCTFMNGQLYLVWTQNDGHLLAMLTGAPHDNAWRWWRGIHHSIDHFRHAHAHVAAIGRGCVQRGRRESGGEMSEAAGGERGHGTAAGRPGGDGPGCGRPNPGRPSPGQQVT